MGARQSYLNIYLRNKDSQYKGIGYVINRSIESVPNCKNFQVVNHSINYDSGDGINFDIYIYDTEKEDSNVSYYFAYCSPGIKTHVAKNVKVYYSIFGPHIPLIISFDRDVDVLNCDVDKLRRDRWNWAAYTTDYSLGTDLTKPLEDAFKKAFWNRTIEFDEGSKPTTNVIVVPQRIDNKNYRIIFIPNEGDPVLNVNCLFTFDTTFKPKYKDTKIQPGCKDPPDNKANNQIDPYYLTSVKGHFYNGIIVYFAREEEQKEDKFEEEHDKNTALIVEFVYLCKTISLVRKDKNCSWWSEEPFNYKDDTDLKSKLGTISDGFKEEVNAVIIEKNSSYKGVSQFKEDKQQAYMKYTHEFGTAKKTVLLFGRKTLDVGPFKILDKNSKHVDVCYLKAGENQDDKPFLIAFYDNDNGQAFKVCHFNNKDEFKDWEELKEVDKLAAKLKKISDGGSCSTHIFWLRKLAYYILTTDEPPPEPPPEEAKPPIRPPVLPGPAPLPPGQNWWLIIGCSVGAFFLIVALAIGYAIYWYNTTIALLT